MSFRKGDSVGVLYSQQDNNGVWTTGIHNGAFLSKDSLRYHVRHSGNTTNACTIGSRTIYFYYNRDDYLYDYNRIIYGIATDVRIEDIYLLAKMYKTKIPDTDTTTKPPIAFVLRDQYDNRGRHVVHNGRFLSFEVKDDLGQTIKIYENYKDLRNDFPTCSSITSINGVLSYVHYNLDKSSPGRYEPFPEVLHERILNLKNLT